MSEPGDKVYAIMPSNLFDCTIVRRNGNGSVVLLDDNLGEEYNAEAICVYKVISRVPAPSLGPPPTTTVTHNTTEATSAPNGLESQASTPPSEPKSKRKRGAK